MSIRKFYDQWPQYNRRMRDVIAAMTDEQLAIQPAPDRWPIWATVGHNAGVRVYWLCAVLGEPGAESTPFPNGATDLGWEDDLAHPRNAAELTGAIDSTWAIVERCLDTWTPEMMGDVITRQRNGQAEGHTRSSVLQRLFTHDAYHCGELSQTLGIARLPQIDLWAAD